MRLVKLRELGSFKNGVNYPKGSYGEGIPIVNVKDLFTSRNVDLSKLVELKTESIKNINDYSLCENDILFSRSSLVQSGAGMCAIVHGLTGITVFCGFIIRFRIQRTDLVNPLYLLYLLRTPMYRNLFTGTQQTNIANINQDSLGNIEVNLPELDIQNRIVNVLNCIDTKIELNNSIELELESMTKRIYDYWFVQYDFPDSNGKPYKSSGGEMVYSEIIKRNIPANWKVDTLSNYVSLERGISYSSKDIKGSLGIPMINLGSFAIGGGYKDGNLKTYSGNYSETKIINPYDLVVCLTQQTSLDPQKDVIGYSMLVPNIFVGDVVLSQDLTKINCPEDLKYYLINYINTSYFHKYITGYASGSNILHLDINGIINARVIIPDKNTLRSFLNLTKPIWAQRSKCLLENQSLTSLRNLLLPMLMNGQVKVLNSNVSEHFGD